MLPSKMSRIPPAAGGFSPDDGPPTSSCFFLAFCWSVREASESMARMAETRSAPAEGAGAGAWKSEMEEEQSGQSQLTKEAGGVGRQGRCHGVMQVWHCRVSEGGGLSLQSMHVPSASHGRW